MSDEEVVPADYARKLFNLQNHTAVVTGGGSGLSAAIAIGYAPERVKVGLLDVNEQGMKAIKGLFQD